MALHALQALNWRDKTWSWVRGLLLATTVLAPSWLIAIHVVDHPLKAEISLAWRQVCSLVGCARPS